MFIRLSILSLEERRYVRFKSLTYYIKLNSGLRAILAVQSRIKNQESEQKESRSRYQTAIMALESTRLPLLNHVPLVVGILLQLLTTLSLLRTLQMTPLVLLTSILDEGIHLRLLRLQQRTPMPLLSRTSLPRKVLDDLALEAGLPTPNPPNQQLLIHPEEKEAKPSLLARKEMT